jgi:hypothetical protein
VRAEPTGMWWLIAGVRGRPFDPNGAVRAFRPYRTATFAVSMAGKRLGDGRFRGIARLS